MYTKVYFFPDTVYVHVRCISCKELTDDEHRADDEDDDDDHLAADAEVSQTDEWIRYADARQQSPVYVIEVLMVIDYAIYRR